MKKNSIEVSIIVVNYNTKILTCNAIRSIFCKTKDIAYEIIVVDNNSTDGSVEYFRNSFRSQIKVIEAGENLGFGKANNIGINEAKGKYILLLNSDTILMNDAIKIFYNFMEKNKNVGICGGNLYDSFGNPAHSYSKKFPSDNIISIILSSIRKKTINKLLNRRDDFNYKEKSIEVAYITGADMFLRMEVVTKCGAFDPDFFMYYEETELSFRVKKMGYQIVSVPQARIIHLEGKSFNENDEHAKFNAMKYSMAVTSKYKFFDKVYGEKRVRRLFRREIIMRTLLSSIVTVDRFNEDKRRIIIEIYSKWKDLRKGV